MLFPRHHLLHRPCVHVCIIYTVYLSISRVSRSIEMEKFVRFVWFVDIIKCHIDVWQSDLSCTTFHFWFRQTHTHSHIYTKEIILLVYHSVGYLLYSFVVSLHLEICVCVCTEWNKKNPIHFSIRSAIAHNAFNASSIQTTVICTASFKVVSFWGVIFKAYLTSLYTHTYIHTPLCESSYFIDVHLFKPKISSCQIINYYLEMQNWFAPFWKLESIIYNKIWIERRACVHGANINLYRARNPKMNEKYA